MIVELVTAFLGSVGFALLFGVRHKFLIHVGIGGLLGWAIYLGTMRGFNNIFLCCFLAAAFTTLYSEILARVLKAPATLFFIPSIVPLIPGSMLYYMLNGLVSSDLDAFSRYGGLTLQYASAIACGASLVWAFNIIFKRIVTRDHKKV